MQPSSQVRPRQSYEMGVRRFVYLLVRAVGVHLLQHQASVTLWAAELRPPEATPPEGHSLLWGGRPAWDNTLHNKANQIYYVQLMYKPYV